MHAVLTMVQWFVPWYVLCCNVTWSNETSLWHLSVISFHFCRIVEIQQCVFIVVSACLSLVFLYSPRMHLIKNNEIAWHGDTPRGMVALPGCLPMTLPLTNVRANYSCTYFLFPLPLFSIQRQERREGSHCDSQYVCRVRLTTQV